MLPHIKSKVFSPLPDRTIFFELTGRVAARKGKYKLVGGVESSRADWKNTALELRNKDLELYDLSADIREKRNLKDSLPDVYRSMKHEMIHYFESIQRGAQ